MAGSALSKYSPGCCCGDCGGDSCTECPRWDDNPATDYSVIICNAVRGQLVPFADCNPAVAGPDIFMAPLGAFHDPNGRASFSGLAARSPLTSIRSVMNCLGSTWSGWDGEGCGPHGWLPSVGGCSVGATIHHWPEFIGVWPLTPLSAGDVSRHWYGIMHGPMILLNDMDFCIPLHDEMFGRCYVYMILSVDVGGAIYVGIHVAEVFMDTETLEDVLAMAYDGTLPAGQQSLIGNGAREVGPYSWCVDGRLEPWHQCDVVDPQNNPWHRTKRVKVFDWCIRKDLP